MSKYLGSGNLGQHRAGWRAVLPWLAGLGGLLAACSSNSPPPRAPGVAESDPAAPSYQLGAAKNTHYKADITVARSSLHMVVREESECDLIPISTVVQNGERKRIAGPPTSTKPCDQRFARDVAIALEVNGNTYELGRPNARGELRSALGDRLARSLYEANTSSVPVAKVIVRDHKGETQEVATVELTELLKAEQRLDQLLAEFRQVLDRPQQQLSGAELTRAYELYEQLAAYASDDPRIGALQALFLERLYQRKSDEATERFKKNLEALNVAKDILMANRTTLVLPGYVSTAIEAGNVDVRTVDWARGQAALALRHDRTLCGTSARSEFHWSRLNLSPPPAESKLAFEVLRFAYDDPYAAELTALCQRLYG
jgi:hypothetical protein